MQKSSSIQKRTSLPKFEGELFIIHDSFFIRLLNADGGAAAAADRVAAADGGGAAAAAGDCKALVGTSSTLLSLIFAPRSAISKYV